MSGREESMHVRRLDTLKGDSYRTYGTQSRPGFALKARSALNPQDDAPNARSALFRHSARSRRPVTLPVISMPLAEDEA